jgi:hypothetical protein
MSVPAYLEKVRDVIHTIARHEDSELMRFSGKGVLSMPELAFVHQVAKELSSRSGEVFDVATIRWEMNQGIGAGLTDLVVVPQGQERKRVALEFKLGGDGRKWIDDLEKLKRLNSAKYDRVFCALADVFVGDLATHGRIRAIDEYPGTERIGGDFDFFTTRTSFVTQTCCVVGVWWVSANNCVEATR